MRGGPEDTQGPLPVDEAERAELQAEPLMLGCREGMLGGLPERSREMIMEKVKRLSCIPVFSALSSERLAELAASGEMTAFSSGQEIQTPDGVILVIEDGEVNCFIVDAADKKFLVGTSVRGDVLGELSSLCPDGGNDQKVELEAVGPVTCFQMQASRFLAALDVDKAVMHLLQMEAKRLAGMNAFARQAVDIEIDPTVHKARTFGEWLADAISAKIGSWQFLLGGAIFTGAWIGANVAGLFGGMDPYPFILLNLVFSVVSAATMPVLLMSQNRQSQRDRDVATVTHLMTLRANQLHEAIAKKQIEHDADMERIAGMVDAILKELGELEERRKGVDKA